jgi:hypothetical protein
MMYWSLVFVDVYLKKIIKMNIKENSCFTKMGWKSLEKS